MYLAIGGVPVCQNSSGHGTGGAFLDQGSIISDFLVDVRIGSWDCSHKGRLF